VKYFHGDGRVGSFATVADSDITPRHGARIFPVVGMPLPFFSYGAVF
jgi:hypothetical protein